MDIPREIDDVLLLNPTEQIVRWWAVSTHTGTAVWVIEDAYSGFFVLTNQNILFVAKKGLVFKECEMTWKLNLGKIVKIKLTDTYLVINESFFISASNADLDSIANMIKDERNKLLSKVQDVQQSTPHIQQSQPISTTNLKICPYCGKDLNLNLPKPPKFCPYCREQIS